MVQGKGMKWIEYLVTGGAGFIGSNLVDRLIEEGHKVVVIDNLSTGKMENVHNEAKFYQLDICSKKIRDIFKKEKKLKLFIMKQHKLMFKSQLMILCLMGM